ncbi:MAG: hypothetical protein FGM24_08995, partial [Candidatus Kapabacteria bacterium]|nr:hypothetical protein [Candidatus Kapabacteria bacterium]
MSMNDHILELLDGELDPMVEPSVYAELASNADLRSEFRQQLAIRTAVQQDRAKLIPPAALTGAIFTGLGFATPIAGAAAGAAGGSAVVSWITKLGLPMLTAAAAAGMTWVATQQTNDARLPARETPPAVAQTVEPPAAADVPAAAAPTTARSTDMLLDRAADQAAEARRALAAAERENDRLRAALAEAEQRIPPQNLESPAPMMSAETPTPAPLASAFTLVNDVRILRSADERPINTATYRESVLPWQQYPAFMVQARGISSAPLATVSVPAQSSWLNNAGLSLLYQLSDHHGVGIEFGSETFAQVFEGLRNGQRIRYEQQPSASWAGIFYRYQHQPLAEGFLPFAQAFAGGSRFGPIGRATVGVSYA